MPNIYELNASFMTLWSLIEDGEVEDAVILDAFQNLTDDLKDKLENCCKYITNEKALIAGLKEEEERLAAKRKAKEKGIERLKALMQTVMETAGEKKLPCGSFLVYIQKNPESVVLDEQYIENIPEEYLRIKEPEVDKKKLLTDLKAGKNLEGIAHIVQETSLRIK